MVEMIGRKRVGPSLNIWNTIQIGFLAPPAEWQLSLSNADSSVIRRHQLIT